MSSRKVHRPNRAAHVTGQIEPETGALLHRSGGRLDDGLRRKRRTTLLARVTCAVVLATSAVAASTSSAAPAAETLRPETLGMRASGGFPDQGRLDKIEAELGRPLSWYVAFADRRSPSRMRSSVRGQVKAGSVFGERPGEINVVMTMPLAFGTGSARTAAGRASIAKRLQETADGKWDDDFRLAAQTLIDAGHGNAVLRLGHEFTGAWYPWSAQGNASAYIAAYRHIHDVMAAESANFRFEWNAARNTFNAHGPEAYPGDEYVDIVSIDVYYEPWKGDPDPLTADVWDRRYVKPMSIHRDFAIEHGKQVAYTEWANGSIDAPKFIEWMYEWFVGLPESGGGSLAYQSYFNASNNKYNLDKHPQSKAAYLRLFAAEGGDEAPTSLSVDVPDTLDVTADVPLSLPATINADSIRWWKVSGPRVKWNEKDVARPTVTFVAPGTYVLKVKAKSADGQAVTASVTVTATNEPIDPPTSTVPTTTQPTTTTVPTTTQPTTTTTTHPTDGSSPTMSVRNASGVEGSKLVFKFVASSPVTQDIVISYVVNPRSATEDDYRTSPSGQLTLAAGSKVAYLGVPTIADQIQEPVEKFQVKITAVTGASIGDGAGTGEITDR